MLVFGLMLASLVSEYVAGNSFQKYVDPWKFIDLLFINTFLIAVTDWFELRRPRSKKNCYWRIFIPMQM